MEDEAVEITISLPLKFNFMGEVAPITYRKMYKYEYFKENIEEVMKYLEEEVTRIINKNEKSL